VGIVIEMLARVSPVGGHVDTAAESDGVIDDDNLLMMRGSLRMRSIELEVDALARNPVQLRERMSWQ
jgi:hypothetical protein